MTASTHRRRALATLLAIPLALAAAGCSAEGTVTDPSVTALDTRQAALRADGGPRSGYGAQVSGERRAVIVSAAQNFLNAEAAGDWGKACATLTASARETVAALADPMPRLTGLSCPSQLRDLAASFPLRLAGARGPLEVNDVRGEGDRAFVFYDSRWQPSAYLPLRREAGEWLADSITGLSAQ